MSAIATGSIRTTVRLRTAYSTCDERELRPRPCRHQPEKEEHREIEQLAPLLGELDAVLAGVLEADLHRQPGDERGDEHARADRLGGEQAEQRQRDHAELLQRFRHPAAAPRQSEQPAADQADAAADRDAVAELLDDEARQVAA